jgi:tRNA A37 threonylcarbamoyladenosine modification protein TsaB
VRAEAIRVVSDSDLLIAVARDPVYGLGIDLAAALPGAALNSRGEFLYDGADLINLGRVRLLAGAADDPAALEPLYLQKAIAQTRFEQKHG